MTDSFSSPLKVIDCEDKYGAWLIVPTQSDGATINKSGWEIGGGSLSRTTSSGTVEENPYVDIICRLYIHSDSIEMGVMLDDDRLVMKNVVDGKVDGPNRTIKIPLVEITDVRQETISDDGLMGADVRKSLGFTFETADDVYRIKMQSSKTEDKSFLEQMEAPKGNWKFKNESLISRTVEQIMENRKRFGDKSNNSEARETIADDLERLNELHKKGVLTDDEFKKAKNRLLD